MLCQPKRCKETEAMKNICHGIEFGSASIKAVTIGSSFKPISFSDYT